MTNIKLYFVITVNTEPSSRYFTTSLIDIWVNSNYACVSTKGNPVSGTIRGPCLRENCCSSINGGIIQD